ncbi:MAG: helix-turn-helix transcriptional regulator [Oscillospiraceae bacterium]
MNSKNDFFKFHTRSEDFLKTEFDKDAVHKLWNDDNYFFCTIRQVDDKIVLANANAAYFRVINKSCNCCGTDIMSYLPEKYAAFITDMFSNPFTSGKTYKYIRESACSGDTWIVTAVCGRGEIKFAGKLLNDLSLLSCRDMDVFRNINCDSTEYVGTVIVSAENDDFFAESCSEGILSTLPEFSHRISLKKAAEKYMYINSSLNVLRDSIMNNMPVSYYDLSSAEPGSHPAVYRFSVFPSASALQKMAAVTIQRTDSDMSEKNTDSIGYAVCNLCRTEKGSVFIRSMNNIFSLLLQSGEIPYSEICNEKLFTETEQSRNLSVRSSVCGKKGFLYNLRIFPKKSDDSINELIILVNVIPKASALSKLSPREHDVLSLAADGYPSKYIACVLDISENTVNAIIHSGYKKLGVVSRVELAKMYGSPGGEDKK